MSKRLPHINEVVAHVLATAKDAKHEKIASETLPPKEYSSDVAQALKKLAQHLRSSSNSITYEDVLATGKRLLRTP